MPAMPALRAKPIFIFSRAIETRFGALFSQKSIYFACQKFDFWLFHTSLNRSAGISAKVYWVIYEIVKNQISSERNKLIFEEIERRI